MQYTWLVTLMVAASILAGCGGSGEKLEDVGNGGQDGPATHGPTGSLIGEVTDDEEFPIPNATVAIPELSVEDVTDAGGQFELRNLTLGSHSLVAHHPDYASRGLNVKVQEGVGEVTIRLQKLEVIEVRNVTTTLDGRMTCGATAVPWCSAFFDHSDIGGPNPTNERFSWYWDWDNVSDLPESQVLEFEWTKTTDLGARMNALYLRIDWSDATGEGDVSLYSSPIEAEESPIRFVILKDKLQAAMEKLADPDDRFFIGLYPDFVGATINQPFQLHRTDFFGEPNPEGWSYIEERDKQA